MMPKGRWMEWAPRARQVGLVTLLGLGGVACDPDAGGPPPVDRVEVPVFSLTEHWPVTSEFAGVQPGQLVFTNSGEDTVTIADPEDGREIYRAPIGLFPMQAEGPHHVALLNRGAHLLIPLSNYVPGSGSGPHGSHGTGTVPGVLLKLSGQTLLLEGQARLDRSPGDVVVNSAGTTAYVSHYDLVKIQQVLARGGTPAEMASTVAVVDVATMERRHLVPVCAGTHGMGLSTDETRLYVTCAFTDELGILDLTTDPPTVTRAPLEAQATQPPNSLHEPYALSVHPTDGTVWVSNLRSKSLRIYNPDAQTWTEGPVFLGSPMFGRFVGEDRYMVPIRESSELALVDVQTRMLARPVLELGDEVCINTHAVELSADFSTAWVVCEGNQVDPGTVVVLDVPPFAVRGSAALGVFPDTVKQVR